MKDSGYTIIVKGLVTQNPVLVLTLGMCPTLATTNSALNGMSMGLATLLVLLGSNIVISLLKNVIPDKIRIPAYVVVIATFVSVIDMIIHAHFPALHESLGIFIPLIVVNCIVLGRAEAFASKNNVFRSALDGLAMGLGFTMALTLLGAIRELLGSGKIFGHVIYSEHYGALLFVLAPGAFITLGFLISFLNKLKKTLTPKGEKESFVNYK
ncbi:MAG: electron transport complex subunit E [Paludibacter sp.]